ncbi:MAG: leader peptidase (prepilin peptidase)/N-methyltransferase [Alphaproteobacteria bacterium]|jgi:leader peptidase (prepilin peptidase)/N-methyltransferase
MFVIEQVNIVLHLMSQEWPWIFPLIVIALGGIFGSFLTCMLYRVPRVISLTNPPSYCPNCDVKLKAIDLIPIVSYLIFKGKCHYCAVSVSPRYFLIELLTIAIFIVVYIMVGAQIALLPALVLCVSLLFVIGLWVESRLVAIKVLLFSIIVTSVLLCLMR